MKTIAIVAIVAALGALFISYSNSPTDIEYQEFIAQFGRNMASTEEYSFRRDIFYKNLKKIEEHNAKGKSWTLGVNEYSDWTDEEYGRLLGLKNSHGQNSNLPLFKSKNNNLSTDDDIDWRNVPGYVGAVKNQLKCGSCWAFSAAQALEGAYFKKYQKEVIISESQVVDCDFFSHGCNGGLQENAFVHWMRTAPRLESSYPYVPLDQTCQEDLIPGDLEELPIAFRVDQGDGFLYDALTHQPVAISIRAENDSFRSYKGGIIDVQDDCGTYIDHAVLLVGYVKADNAWIVKNSWGPNWGEHGYVRIRRSTDSKGVCGINQQNSLPVYLDDF